MVIPDNGDLAEIQRVIDNIDTELDEWINTSDFEDQKLEYLIEHIKKITVCKNNHLIIELDLIGGAIIAGKDFFLFVSESMPKPDGGVCDERPYVQGRTIRAI